MADVEVTYRGQIIRSMSASGTEVLHTEGKYCDDDITIDYTSPGGGGANLQTKSVSYTPDETGISDTILPDPGYDGLDEVDVTVDAIPDTYVGSAIPQRDSSDLLVTGRLVRAPAGYYAALAGAQVSLGTEGTPTASKGAVSNHSVDVTPSVTNTTGWITGSTITGTPVTVSASELVSGSQTVTVNDTYDVTNLAEMVVNVSGSTELDIKPGSQQMNLIGTFPGITRINIKPASTATWNYCSFIMPYLQKNETLVEYVFTGMNTNFKSSGNVSDYCRACKNIKGIDFGGAYLPASFTNFFYYYEKTSDAATIHIKGLNFTNCTTFSGFQTDQATAQFVNAGIFFDVEWNGTLNMTSFNLRSSAAAAVPFTHDSLVDMIDHLGTNGGTVTIGTYNLNQLSAAEIAVATGKGWTISA